MEDIVVFEPSDTTETQDDSSPRPTHSDTEIWTPRRMETEIFEGKDCDPDALVVSKSPRWSRD